MSNIIAGGWSIPETPELTDEVRKIFEEASSDLMGAKAEPFAYLGSQLVSGRNYKVVARVTPIAPDAHEKLSVYTIYKSLDEDKKAEITDIVDI
jgi:hypothetical protein